MYSGENIILFFQKRILLCKKYSARNKHTDLMPAENLINKYPKSIQKLFPVIFAQRTVDECFSLL